MSATEPEQIGYIKSLVSKEEYPIDKDSLARYDPQGDLEDGANMIRRALSCIPGNTAGRCIHAILMRLLDVVVGGARAGFIVSPKPDAQDGDGLKEPRH